jgi:hypothetical protein
MTDEQADLQTWGFRFCLAGKFSEKWSLNGGQFTFLLDGENLIILGQQRISWPISLQGSQIAQLIWRAPLKLPLRDLEEAHW